MAQQMYHGRSSRRPWRTFAGTVSVAIMFAAAGVWIYTYLAAWEAAGQPAQTFPRTLVLLHELGGKTLVGALFAVLSLGLLGIGARQLRENRITARGQHDTRL
ncbi:MAG: hypothetical protein AAGK21_08250 [Bacteroidota bacterium]